MSNAKHLEQFQQDAILRIKEEHRAGRRTLLCLPTGTGKTRVAVNYANDEFVRHQLPVLWVAHTEELLRQAYATFEAVGVNPRHMARRFGRFDELKRFVRTPLVTFVNSAGKQGPDEASLVIVDEAHHAAGKSYTQWLSRHRAFARDGARLLGLTATPYRLKNGEVVHLTNFGFSKPLVPIFESVAYEKSFCELVDLGRVAPFVREQVETHLRFVPKVQNGEISKETLEELNTPTRNRIIVEAWRSRRSRWGKTIVFVGTQDHARALTRAFGSDANFLTSENADARETVLSQFRRGDVPVLVNVRMLGEGLDVPDVQTVIIARPTMSPMLYLQMVGRGSRITNSKRFFFLVDVHDQLGEFEHYLAGVDDLAERKPGLLEANSKRARAAQALAEAAVAPPKHAEPDLPVEAQAEDVSVAATGPTEEPHSSMPLASDHSYSVTLRTLLGRAREGQSFDGVSLRHHPVGWWEVHASGKRVPPLVVLAADEQLVQTRIGRVGFHLTERLGVPTIWATALTAISEDVFRGFVDSLVEQGGAAQFRSFAQYPDRLVEILEGALASAITPTADQPAEVGEADTRVPATSTPHEEEYVQRPAPPPVTEEDFLVRVVAVSHVLREAGTSANAVSTALVGWWETWAPGASQRVLPVFRADERTIAALVASTAKQTSEPEAPVALVETPSSLVQRFLDDVRKVGTPPRWWSIGSTPVAIRTQALRCAAEVRPTGVVG